MQVWSCVDFPWLFRFLGVVLVSVGTLEFHFLVGHVCSAGPVKNNDGLTHVFLANVILFSSFAQSETLLLVSTFLCVATSWIYSLFTLPGFIRQTKQKDTEMDIAHRQVIALAKFFSGPLSLLYVGWSMSFYFLLRDQQPYGAALCLIGLLCSWAGDGAGFFVGRKMGKTRLFPEISPNKTLEGLIANIIATMLAGFLFHLIQAFDFLGLSSWSRLPNIGLIGYLLLSFAISVVGQLGDAVESLLKRLSQCKDAGSFFPGHGGVLDRLDALIFLGPFLYFSFKFHLSDVPFF